MRSIGNEGESVAVAFLESHGWKILDRNVHKRYGEIDILADEGVYIVLVEVKVKRGTTQGNAIEMITPKKQQTLLKLAYFLQTQYNKPVRIDVIAIDNFSSSHPEITHYPFAVGE